MAALFRDFSFSAASRHPSQIDLILETDPTAPSCPDNPPTSIPCSAQYTMSPSPFSFACSSSPSMAELQDSFSRHHISTSSSQDNHLPLTYYDCFRTPQYSSELSMDLSEDNQYHFAPQTHSSNASSSSHLARRLQRQQTSRLQCTPAHLSKLSSLLEAMIDREDQCCSYSTSSATSTSHSSASSDAGDTENSSSTLHDQPRCRRSSDSDLLQSPDLRYRRSGDILREGACVVKSVRVRKRGPDRRKRISR